MIGFKTADPRPIPLSWLDHSIPRALSPDGSLLAFTELSQGAGPGGAVCVRKTDGSPSVKLGEGDARSLSDDGEQVLALVHGSPPQYVVYSTKMGGSTKMDVRVTNPMGALFHPDGKRIIFEGGPSSGDQLWIQDKGSGQAKSFSPTGVSMTGQALSPDGQWVAAIGADGKLMRYPVEGGAARPVSLVLPTDRVIQWSKDSKSLFVYNPSSLPARIERLDPATGKRELLRELVPQDLSGVQAVDLVMSSDLGTVVLGLQRQLSTVQIVEGLS